MALRILAEAVLRIEHKIDLLLKHLKPTTQLMHFPGQLCPVCNAIVDYQVDLSAGVVIRKCNCKTGKLPSMFQLTPVQNGEIANARTKAEPSNAEVDDPGRGRRKGGG